MTTLDEWKAAHARGRAEALGLEARDPVRTRRDLFHVPPMPGDASRESIYLCGNSLGLQPRSAQAMIEKHLEDWARLGVEAHFEGHDPWKPYHEWFAGPLARLVGAHEDEVAAMNSLTTNLHLLMASFFRPRGARRKIMIELPAFPSDVYAVKSQLRFHGLDSEKDLVCVTPREGEQTWRDDDILETIEREKDSLALVLLSGVNYVTGQRFDMETITRKGREAGAVVGWDLAHAAGNVELKLHDWGADFAAWCSYKYLNGGPGAVAGAFVHRRWWTGKHAAGFAAMSRFEGWWGNDPATRFRMAPEFDPIRGVEAWCLSNPPILALAPVKASLQIFDEAGMANLRARSVRLTAYLERLLDGLLQALPESSARLKVITPREPEQRGAQLSLRIVPASMARSVLEGLNRGGVMCDFREPDVVRVAPTPLYNTYEDCWRFVGVLGEVLVQKRPC